jgi:hypothetical protein
MIRMLVLVSVVASLAGCSGGAKVAGTASPTDTAAFDRLKKLEGDWVMIDDKGAAAPGSVFRVASQGSALREVMFPGAEHEMTNMYHMDGDSVVLTHYCAVGNQPRMRARADASNALRFEFESVTNLRAADEAYMGSMTLTFVDPETIKTDWTHFNPGKEPGGVSFTYKRKK